MFSDGQSTVLNTSCGKPHLIFTRTLEHRRRFYPPATAEGTDACAGAEPCPNADSEPAWRALAQCGPFPTADQKSKFSENLLTW